MELPSTKWGWSELSSTADHRRFIADFYCHSAALAVEVDSPSHDPAYDAERDRIFAERGIYTYRCTNEEVMQRIGIVLSNVKSLVQQRASRRE